MSVQMINRALLSRDEAVLVDLVATPSVSGSERRASGVLCAHAREFGLSAEIDEAGSAIVHRGPADAAVHLVLLGHIDTVPGEIPVRIEAGELHGRGSVDAKGPLAAMLCAAARADLPGRVRVTVVGAAGEETPDSPGARLVVSRMRPDACIIGEPSGWDGVTLGYKGRLLVDARIDRPHFHSAGPDSTACDELAGWWSRVRERAAAFNTGRARAFDQLQATVQGWESSCDGLTQRASMRCGFRLPPAMTPEGLRATLAALAPEGMTLEVSGAERAHQTDRNDAVVRALSSAIRGVGGQPRPKLKTGTADFNIAGPAWGCPIAAYGPGDSSLDHTPGERLPLAEYARSIGVLCGAIESLSRELLVSCAEDAPAGVDEEEGALSGA